MKMNHICRKQQGAFAILMTFFFVALGCLAVAGAITWAQTNARLTERNNEYVTSVCAAEAAIESVRTEIGYLYANGVPEPSIQKMTGKLKVKVPKAKHNKKWSDYTFSDPSEPGVAATLVRKSGTNVPFYSESFKGLASYASTYQIIANVKNTNSQHKIPVCVGAELLLGTTPLFQYAIFYQEDMEIHPGADMMVNGQVHGNADIYLSSNAKLTMGDVVSATGKIFNPGGKQGDPTDRSAEGAAKSTVKKNPFQGGANSLNLPIGTNQMGVAGSSSNNIHAVLEVPPWDEPHAYGEVGTNRYYNKADLVIKLTDTSIEAIGGVYLYPSAEKLDSFPYKDIVDPSGVFYDGREKTNINSTAIDIGALKTYSETNTELRGFLQPLGDRDIATLYVVDQRTKAIWAISTNLYGSTVPPNAINVVTIQSSNKLSGVTTPPPSPPLPYVNYSATTNKSGSIKYSYTLLPWYRYDLKNWANTNYTGTNVVNYRITNKVAEAAVVLTNGAMLPSGGLTLATPNPVYIKGDYNTTTNGTDFSKVVNDTVNTRPAAVLCDAITILSSNWKDTTNTSGMQTAGNTTVNAALVSGNVPTTTVGGNSYSGGVENFMRLLENWGSKTLTYNGSIVVLFPSQTAKGKWSNPGTGSGNYYNAPIRSWAFDVNFLNSSRLPTNTPNALVIRRGAWKILPPGSTNF